MTDGRRQGQAHDRTETSPPLSEAAREAVEAFNVRIARHWWAMALRGAAAILLGALVVAWPPVTLLSLVLLFGVYCVIDAILSATLAVRGARRGGRWEQLAFNALLGLIAGGIAIFYPGVTLLVFALLLGAWAVL